MYKVAYRDPDNIKREFNTYEDAEKYIYYLLSSGYSEAIYLIENDTIIDRF